MSRTTSPRRTLAGSAALVLAGVTAASVTATVAGTPALATDRVADAALTTAEVDPNDALLTARTMPVVNEVQDWTRVAVRHRRVSNAQPEPLSALGFESKARRDFALPGAQSTNVVLTFADTDKARAAYAAIKGWRQHTGDHVPAGGALLYTSPSSSVDVERGRGAFFAFVFKTDKDDLEGTFEWLGVTRRGTSVSVVAWRVGGQDATYDVDPTIASVQEANVRLGRLG